MATKEKAKTSPGRLQVESDGKADGKAAAEGTLSITDSRTGETYEVEITDGTIKTMDLRQIKVSEDDFGMMGYDPAFTNTASCRSAITYIDGEAGILAAPRDPDRAALGEEHLPRGRLPPGLRRAADAGPARPLDLRRHAPHLRPRGHQEDERGLPPRRAPDGDAARLGRRALDLLPGREAHRRPRGALHGGDQADRQGADARRLRLPPQPRAALRLSRQRAQLLRELPLDAVQDGEQLRARPAPGEGPRRALHPPRRPRAELLDQRGPLGRLLGRRPVLGGRGRRRRALRPAARRRQRGGAADAAPDRDDRQHPRLPRGRQEPRGEADGLRPPGLQELRPAGADHQEARGRGAGGDRREPAAGHRHRAREAGARRRVLHRRASSTRTSTSTRA